MPSPLDVLIPLTALGIGSYAVIKVVQSPQFRGLQPPLGRLPAFPANGIIQIGSNGTTPNAPASASTQTGQGFSFTPNAPQSASTFFQRVINMLDPRAMTISKKGRDNFISEEGFSNAAYQDDAGKWTIGIGHKIVPGDGFGPNSKLTDEGVNQLFAHDMIWVINTIHNYVRVPLTQNQFDALADFIFNVGGPQFESSTLLQVLNSGNYAAAADQFKRWVYAGGHVDPILLARRERERQTFLT